MTFAQLMVNMTSANALCNMVNRMVIQKEVESLAGGFFELDAIRRDLALQNA